MGWFTKSKPEEKEEENNQEFGKPLVKSPPVLPELPKSEVREIKSTIENNRPMSENRMLPPRFSNVSMPPSPVRREAEPIFVKIDKFKEASENFEKIKEKVSEIEVMLKEIQKIKEKEDSELKDWENEIQAIKTRVESIDNSLFKKLE